MAEPSVNERGADAAQELVNLIEPGSIMTKFVMIIEVMDRDGERALWQLTGSEAKAWDTLGLLTHALNCEQAATTATHLRND